MKNLRFGTFNVRGMQQEFDKQNLADDMKKYGMHFLAVQETHLKGNGSITLKTRENAPIYSCIKKNPRSDDLVFKLKKVDKYEISEKEDMRIHLKRTKEEKPIEYTFYHHGSDQHCHHGVGIVTTIPECTFTDIHERIISAKAKIGNKTLIFICAYAPTLQTSERCPELRDEFYDALESYIQQIPKSYITVLAGDFNAKVGIDKKMNINVIGSYGKGMQNSNGARLLETATKNGFILSNTLFCHKLAHITTWTSTDRKSVV